MNYIRELKAFRDWLLLNELPTSAIALWYTLMAINNMTGWKERFNAPNSVVEKLTGLSKQGLANARKTLIEKGLIEYEAGKKGKAPIYKMVSLVNSVDPSLDQLVDQSLDQSGDESLTIPKHKQKQNNNNGQNEYTTEFEEFWKHYPRKVGKREAFAKWKTRLKQGETPERLIQACINYAKECKRLGTEEKFIKHGKTFLSDKKPYEDYLDVANDKPNGQVREPSLFDMEVALNKHIAAGGSPDDFDIDKWYRQRGVGS